MMHTHSLGRAARYHPGRAALGSRGTRSTFRQLPRRVEFSESELPKGGSGKILKSALRERFWIDQKRAVG
jgi:hypothetical protein